MKGLDKLIKEKRTAQHWTQKELSNHSGVSVSTISRIERADYERIKKNNIFILFDALGIKKHEFTFEIDATLKTVMENELFEFLTHAFRKEYQEVQKGLLAFTKKYEMHQENPYFSQLLLFAESIALADDIKRVKGITKAVKGLALTHPLVILEKRVDDLRLDLKYIEDATFTLIEYGLIKRIGDSLNKRCRYQQSMPIYKALITSLEKPTVNQDFKVKQFSVICNNLAHALQEVGDLHQALIYMEQGIAYCVKTGNARALPHLYGLGAEIHIGLGDMATAEIYTQKKSQLAMLEVV